MLTTNCDCRIRWVLKRDLQAIVSIEASNSCKPNPHGGRWDKNDFLKVLGEKGNTAIVAERKEIVVGFCCYGLMEDRFHIYNLVVRKDVEKMGIGSMLIDRMKGKLNPKRRRALDFDIRETNLSAQLFLREQGFKAISVVRDWYKKPRLEDAYKFRYVLEENVIGK